LPVTPASIQPNEIIMNTHPLHLRLLSLVAAALATTATVAHDAPALPDANILPARIVQISPVVPLMGEHWAETATLPLGPIYCVHEGKIVCLEFMISQADFEAGKSWPALSGIKGLPPVDHVSVGFEPQGHEGFEVPHFDVHMFFISPEQVQQIR
jgi:hypothetical protein